MTGSWRQGPRPALLRRAPFLVAMTAIATGSSACIESRRALGEDCLKPNDCLSGICSQLHCAASPVLTDAQAASDAGAGSVVDGAGD